MALDIARAKSAVKSSITPKFLFLLDIAKIEKELE